MSKYIQDDFVEDILSHMEYTLKDPTDLREVDDLIEELQTLRHNLVRTNLLKLLIGSPEWKYLNPNVNLVRRSTADPYELVFGYTVFNENDIKKINVYIHLVKSGKYHAHNTDLFHGCTVIASYFGNYDTNKGIDHCMANLETDYVKMEVLEQLEIVEPSIEKNEKKS